MGLADSAGRVAKLHANKKTRPSCDAQAARAMFLRYTDTFILQGTKRFQDVELPQLLDCVRKGRPVPLRKDTR